MELLWSMIYVGVTGLISFYVGAAIPRKWFDDNKYPFLPYKWEKDGKIYERFNIRKWKGEIIDMSKIMNNILPKKLMPSAKVYDIQRLIEETCVAEVVHWVLCITSFGNYWIWKKTTEGIFVWILCIIGNLPFIIVQRYNRPHLRNIRDKMMKRKKYQSSEV